eukprot:GHRR01022190.1.p2 GENE.GHRR01022190.1~~GHRR01022190.1.p2  ORF type:complete len:178 (+),score=65.74 GHRR01022190.1:125-658(+)
MVEQVETAMFDVFDQANAPQWKQLRARFNADNEDVKAATRELIDTSFRKLRSAEGAFELLQNFKSIKSRGAIQQQVMNKLVDILEQFLREIVAAQEMFDRWRSDPPLTRNQPPVAGMMKGPACCLHPVLPRPCTICAQGFTQSASFKLLASAVQARSSKHKQSDDVLQLMHPCFTLK